ncbi:hypothetical protein [Selenomonas sp.]|uniref:hypothetical protein n=1 Tax=Selenomonas sp. TaxID=2053611 RepID=UPI003FA1F5EF
MLQLEKVREAMKAVDVCCGKCEICSPDCPVFVAKRALAALFADLEEYEAASNDDCP